MSCAPWDLKYHGLRDMTRVNATTVETLTISIDAMPASNNNRNNLYHHSHFHTDHHSPRHPNSIYRLISNPDSVGKAFTWRFLRFPTISHNIPDQINKVQRVHPVSPNLGNDCKSAQ